MEKVADLENQTEPKAQPEEVTKESGISQPLLTDPHPLTEIQYADAVRFEKPIAPTFSLPGSINSVLSLLFMSGMATLMYLQLTNPSALIDNAGWNEFLGAFNIPANSSALPTWVWLPFAFTIFGATLGWVFELGLILSGTPFQQQRNKFTQFISKVRFLNLAPVATTLLFFVCAITITEPNLRTATLVIASGLTGALGFALFFGTRSPLLPMTLLGIQLVQIGIILGSSSAVVTSSVALLLIGQAVLQFTSLLVGTATPGRSTFFHVTSTIAGILLFAAIMEVNSVNTSFAESVAPQISAGSLLLWSMIAALVAGVVLITKALPDSYNNFRVVLSNSVWSPIYFKLISAKRFPDPINLSQIYDKNPPRKTSLKPYYQVHPEHLLKNLSIPAVGDNNLERNVTVFKDLLKQAESAFKLISWLDHNIPQANLKEPLENKPRLAVWSNGSDVWPSLFHKTLFGNSMPNHGNLMQTPETAIAKFKEGQLLAYLAESGVANTFLRRAEGLGEGILVTDFTHLEKYNTKPDYEPYGGIAYFKINEEAKVLELIALTPPKSELEIAANPDDPQFRRAEQMILASMYYDVISGKHLAEIHMSYNLVEVSMHNAFDAQGQWRHPFRTFMYLHFFSHELAEEITTEHLVQEGAVFSQIFATTHDAMINHLNDTYSEFEYGTDENFEDRVALMRLANGDILPNACINWELDYVNIWDKYVNTLIDAIYADDQAVQKDHFMQDFHQGLNEVFIKGLPDRYEAFQTKKGVARFAIDTIHHTVVRHQVYGTTGIRAALDPRISTTQVPRDSGTPAIDEWRSLAYVAQATGEARFTLLTGKEGKDFTYLLKGVEEKYREPMAKAFDTLQKDLQALDKSWSEDVIERTFNYNFFRALPSEVHTGPGY